jgi:hypothetical protein
MPTEGTDPTSSTPLVVSITTCDFHPKFTRIESRYTNRWTDTEGYTDRHRRVYREQSDLLSSFSQNKKLG